RERREAIAHDLMVIKSTETGSENRTRSTERPPGQTNSRTEIIFVRFPQTPSKLRPRARAETRGAVVIDVVLQTAGNLNRVPSWIERRDLIDSLDFGQIQIVSQPQIQRELWRDLPIILKVVGRRKCHRVVKRRPQIAVGLPRHSQQQIGNSITGERPIENEGAAAEAGEERIEQEAADVEAEFHAV